MADAAATAALLAQVTRAITDLANAQAAAANAAAAAAAAVPIGGPPPVVQVAPVFALWPGLASNAFLDYNTSDGRKIYSKALAPLSTLYDLNSEGLYTFLAKAAGRARESNWTDILSIPDSNTLPVVHSLILDRAVWCSYIGRVSNPRCYIRRYANKDSPRLGNDVYVPSVIVK
jgi:hypothetical protein